jgi:hypothetical protein
MVVTTFTEQAMMHDAMDVKLIKERVTVLN